MDRTRLTDLLMTNLVHSIMDFFCAKNTLYSVIELKTDYILIILICDIVIKK